MERTSKGLRDIMFDEIAQLQGPNSDPRRALAVANVARQIVNTVRVELDYSKQVTDLRKHGGDVELGTLTLGSQPLVDFAGSPATEPSSGTRRAARAK